MQTEIKQISLREVLHFLGWHGSPLDPQWISTLRALCERVEKEVHPRVIFRRFPIESGGRLQGTSWAAQGEDARAWLASCEEAVLFAATLGAESERMLLREQAISAESALLLDAVLSAAIESVRLSKTDIPVLVCAASADERGVRVALLALAAALAGAAVSFAGLLGFVGLVAPHMVRRLVGGESRRLLAGCALGGAALLTVCDVAARTLFAPYELPVGVVLSLAGGPFFLWLLFRKGRGHP